MHFKAEMAGSLCRLACRIAIMVTEEVIWMNASYYRMCAQI